MKDKLISFPEEMLQALDDYKKLTGIPATDYIRDTVARRMVTDGLIKLKTKTIVIEDRVTEVPEAIKFCDGDKCEVH